MVRGVVALVFRCKVIGGELHPNDEAAQFSWADQSEIAQLAADAYAVRIFDGFQDQVHTSLRHHDGMKVL